MYFKSAEKGGVDAIFAIGTFYDKGIRGLPKDIAMANNWYLRAAKKGTC